MGCTASPAPVAGRGRARRFPAEYRAIRGPARKLSWLSGEECGAIVRSGRLLGTQVFAETRRLNQEHERQIPLASGPAMVEHYDATGIKNPIRADSRNCLMRRARVALCQEERLRWQPHYAVSDAGVAMDAIIPRTPLRVDEEDERRVRGAIDAEALIPPEPTTESPSADARRRLEETGGRLVEAKLQPTDTASLLAEIAAATGQTVVPMTVNFAPG